MHLEKIVIDNIRMIRQKRGISQEKLAELCDTSASYIGLMETYKNIPKLSTIEKIADALNVSAIELFKEDNNTIQLPDQRQSNIILKQKLKKDLLKNIEQHIDDTFKLL